MPVSVGFQSAVGPGLSLLSQDLGKWLWSRWSPWEHAHVGSSALVMTQWPLSGTGDWERTRRGHAAGDRTCSGPQLTDDLEVVLDLGGSGRWGVCHHSPLSQSVFEKWKCAWSRECGPCFHWRSVTGMCGAAGGCSAAGCCDRQVLENVYVNGKGVPKQMCSAALLSTALHYRLLLYLETRICNTGSSCNGSFFNHPSFFFFTCNYNSLQ